MSDLKVIGSSLYVAGHKYWGIAGNSETDAYVAKFDFTGNKKWNKSFGTKTFDSAKAVTADSRGNVYVTGSTSGVLGSESLGDTDVFIRKYKPSGGVAWTQQFSSFGYQIGNAIAAFSPYELYVGGLTTGDLGAGKKGDADNADAFLTRLSGRGKSVWTR